VLVDDAGSSLMGSPTVMRFLMFAPGREAHTARSSATLFVTAALQ
jgi:hypothetical protein